MPAAEEIHPGKSARRPVAMKAECVPCALRLALAAVRQVSSDDWLAAKVIKAVMSDMPEVDAERTPAEYSWEVMGKALKVAGCADPYHDERKRQNRMAEQLLQSGEKALAKVQDRLELAARLAVAGNCFDPLLPDCDPAAYVERALAARPERFDYQEFQQAARAARSVLYILDNCGEAVFDKLLVRELCGRDRTVHVCVRQAPVLNDVTRGEAEELTFSEISTIVDPGRPMLGVVLNNASAQFRELFKSAEMVIAKGQANFETLSGVDRDIFFLLQVKCQVVAEHLGLKCGNACLAYYRASA